MLYDEHMELVLSYTVSFLGCLPNDSKDDTLIELSKVWHHLKDWRSKSLYLSVVGDLVQIESLANIDDTDPDVFQQHGVYWDHLMPLVIEALTDP